MRPAVCSILITSILMFLLGLPMLHLHPGTEDDCDAVIHSHMPHAAGVHHHRNSEDRSVDEDDHDEFKSIPVEISAICPPAPSLTPPLELLAFLQMELGINLDLRLEFFPDPDPKAQPPPVPLVHLSPRSPPA
jgi:hypothetical protein